MARNQKQINTALAVLALLLALPKPGRAYVDPGSGAMIWQVLAAGFIGGLFYVRKFFTRLRNAGGRASKTEEVKSQGD